MKLFNKFAVLFAAAGMLLTSGILKGNVQERLDPFVDPIQYEKPVAEVFKNPTGKEPVAATDFSSMTKIIIHYYNTDKKNNSREIYTWTNGIDEKYSALVQDDPKNNDYWHIELDLTGEDVAYAGKSFVNFIVKNKGTWDGQSADTKLDFEVFLPDDEGVVEVWTMAGKGGAIDVYATKAETQMAKVNEAYFTNWKKIHAVADETPKVYRLYAYDKAYLASTEAVQIRTQPLRLLKEGVPTSKVFDITFNYVAHINCQYVLETEYNSHAKTQSIIVTTYKLYEDTNFVRYYNYNGNDLGCTYTPEKTTFKVWAPTAGAVVLNIYNKGTPKNVMIDGSNIKDSYFMTMQPGGVWEKTLLTPAGGDKIEGKYYTYTVYNSEGVNEVVDPYAKACGVNGRRGMILDFDSTDPTGWDDVTYADIDTPQRLSIYEIHIRDLTEGKEWNGTERPGTFKAFAEKNTRYKTYKTGFDHIEEMNVKAIQIMPMYDHDNAELRYYFKRDASTGEKTAEQVFVHSNYSGEYKDELELEFNWGYNPLNYNCIEGSYSSNPEDGAVRVREFKELVQAYANNKNNTRVTMDVVYNHVSSVTNSNFTKLMPRYYFRFNEAADAYWDGSGCSNEVKSEAPMMRKFIVDSLCWWASEYKIKGFRFDLMELIDMDTLNEARRALYKIDPDIYMYGEGWKAADSGLVGHNGGGSTDNVYSVGYPKEGHVFLGGFNNGGRDSIKGGNDGGSTGKSNFYWDGSEEAPVAGSGYKDYPLNIGGWAAANAEVWVHAWRTTTDTKDYKLTDTSKLRIYDNYTNFVLVRQKPGSSSLVWEGDNFWGQSIDMAVGKGTCMFKDWGSIRTPGRDSFVTSAAGYSTAVGKLATGNNCYCTKQQDARQTVNYASCHDNFTLYDQLSWGLAANPNATNPSTAATTANIMKGVTAVEQAVALSNGVAFILGGDELLRTKVEDHPERSRENEDYVKMFGKCISHNSYKSSINTNAFDWTRKEQVVGYNGSAANTAWQNIANAFAARNKFSKFTSYSGAQGQAECADCNYFNASTTSNYVDWYVGGYVMHFNGNTRTLTY